MFAHHADLPLKAARMACQLHTDPFRIEMWNTTQPGRMAAEIEIKLVKPFVEKVFACQLAWHGGIDVNRQMGCMACCNRQGPMQDTCGAWNVLTPSVLCVCACVHLHMPMFTAQLWHQHVCSSALACHRNEDRGDAICGLSPFMHRGKGCPQVVARPTIFFISSIAQRPRTRPFA